MAPHPHLDDDDDFGGDFPGSHATRRSGTKRSFGDLEDDEDDIFGSNKGNVKAEETAPGVATGMILSLRESLQNCKDTLATCQTELEAAKAEIRNWQSTFQNEPFIPAGTSVEPKLVVSYLQSLKSSEESLREQLEKAKKKEAAFIVTFAKREQERAELKSSVRDLRTQLKPPSMQARRLLLDPAIHEEFTRLKNLVEEKDKKIKELQDNVAAVNFTPQSKMGKMLMAKCRTLQEENDEIGNQANEGKLSFISMAEPSSRPTPRNEKGKRTKYFKPANVEAGKAHWDATSTKIFLQCVICQIRKGNRPHQCLTTKGYSGLMEDYFNITQKFHDQKQMKNKYEALKKDWAAWMHLKNPAHGHTGLGWDEERKTFTAPQFWWGKMIGMHKHCAKFKAKGIEHEDLMEIVFAGLASTGKSQWTPGESLPSTGLMDESSGATSENDDPSGEPYTANLTREDGAPVVGGSSTDKGSDRNTVQKKITKKALRNKKKISGAAALSRTMERMLDVVQSQGSEITVKQFADNNNATIADCLQNLGSIPAITPPHPLYMFALKLITTPANREVFMGLPSDEIRICWLQQERDMMLGTYGEPRPPPNH